MPIYEYQCASCKSETEVLQKSTDPAPAQCDKCGKGPMLKQLSLSSFALKGTGWYETDFKNGSKPAPKSEPKVETGTSSSTAPEATPTPATESKPAAKPAGSTD